MCQRTSRMDVSSEISRLSGRGLESVFMDTIRLGGPRVFDSLGISTWAGSAIWAGAAACVTPKSQTR